MDTPLGGLSAEATESYEQFYAKRVYPTTIRVSRGAIAMLAAYMLYDLASYGPGQRFMAKIPGFAIGFAGCIMMIDAMHHDRFRRGRVHWVITFGWMAMIALMYNNIIAEPRIFFVPYILFFFLIGDLLLAPLLHPGIFILSYVLAIAVIGSMMEAAGMRLSDYIQFGLFSVPALGFLTIVLVRQRATARETWELAMRDRTHAAIDTLTGLLNRRTWYERCEAAIAASTRSATWPAVHSGAGVGGTGSHVALLDIDYFKKVNDTRGHQAGDRALAAVAAALRDTLGAPETGIAGGIAGRLGGEEFGVFIPGAAESRAIAICENLRSAVERLVIPVRDGDLSVTVSIGLARLSGAALDDCVHRADQCLYEAKHAGRNRVVAASV